MTEPPVENPVVGMKSPELDHPQPKRAPWSRRRKVATWTTVGVVGAALGLVALDRGAEVVVEHVVAGKVQDCLGTPDKPHVEISGWPLLPDLVRGRLDHLSMTAHDAKAQSELTSGDGVRVSELRVEADGVERKGAGGTMKSLEGSGLVTYDAISAQAMGMTVSNGGDGSLKISGGLGLLSGSATTTPKIEDGSLVLEPGQVSTSLFGNMDFSGFPAIRIKLRELPSGVNVHLNPTDQGLEFTFDGTNVVTPDNPCGGVS
jgi:hypothetical protein